MRLIKGLFVLLCLLVVVLLGLAFITHNQTVVKVDLLFFAINDVKLGIWLTLFFVFGGILGLLASSALLVKEKAARVRLERRMRKSSKIIAGYSS